MIHPESSPAASLYRDVPPELVDGIAGILDRQRVGRAHVIGGSYWGVRGAGVRAPPYSSKGRRDTTLATDSIYLSAGTTLLVALSASGSGYAGTVRV